MTDLPALHAALLPLVGEVADFLRVEFGRVAVDQVELKSLNQLVSYVDEEAERRLVAGLRGLLPGAAFLAEEGTTATEARGAAQTAEWRWVVDPLDGTTNFLHGLPCFAISVALEHRGRTVLGVVADVMRRETFSGYRGGPALLDGAPLPTLRPGALADALVATGLPFHDFSRAGRYWRALDAVTRRSRGVRRWGAAAIDLAYVAAGRFQGFFEYAMQPWDVAAGCLLVELAGGEVSDLDGGDVAWRDGRELVAGAPGVREGLVACWGAGGGAPG